MTVGRQKIIESIVTLKFDRFLNPRPDRTIIHLGSNRDPRNRPGLFQVTVSPPDEFDLLELYRQHGIDTRGFSVVHDYDLFRSVPADHNQYRFGYWIFQQIVKMTAIDRCEDNKILLQDCDSFMIRPYTYFDQDQPIPLVIPNETHNVEYYKYIEKFTGYPRQTTSCFITEFIPFFDTHWTSLKHRIEQRYQCPWLEAITNQFRRDVAEGKSLWFAEYELIGNWMLVCDPALPTVIQHRFNFDEPWARLVKQRNIDRSFSRFIDQYNTVCLKIYQDDLRLDFSDIDFLVDSINKHIG